LSLQEDTYRTLKAPSTQVLFKDRNSKFYGYAFPIQTNDDIKDCLTQIKSQHPSAGHHCFAYQTGVEKKYHRTNDGGEPSNSAGQPIYGQILSHDLTDVLIVVVRYFGGTKLGVGGLINAYRTTAKLAIENAPVIVRTIDQKLELNFAYKHMSAVMRIIKEENLKISDQRLELDCTIKVHVRKKKVTQTLARFEKLHEVQVDIKALN